MPRARILVVDDEEIVRDSLVRVLGRASYEVDGAASGEEGLKKVRKRGYHLLLVDIKMPGIDGIEFLRQVKKEDPQAAALLITGYGTMEQALRALELGAQGLIAKPVHPTQLLQVVDDVLSRVWASREAQQHQAFAPLVAMSRTILGGADEDQVLRVFVETLLSHVEADQVGLFLRDESGQLAPRVSQGFPTGIPIPSQEALERLETQGGQISDALMAGGGCLSWPELQTVAPGTAPTICLPLLYQGCILGLLLLGQRTEGRSFSRSDVEFLWVLTGLLTPTLEYLKVRAHREG